ncbi:VanZ family protein [Sulfuriferula sp. GW1]|uniref:VanZ family protein n=1 Tax=Sulfuriferula sp. GW1 TaxID=3345111 RepID=UPI0039B0872B
MSNKPERSTLITYAALTYLCFVVYGSLVPLDFHAHSLSEAWQMFLNAGTGSTLISLADRTTNILLAVPLAFFWFGAFAKTGRPLRNIAVAGLIWLACIFVAISVEFLQVFLPTRTSSWGDIVAQAIGALLGIALWILLGRWWIAALQTLTRAAGRMPIGPVSKRAVLLAAIPYFLILLATNGYLTNAWESMAGAADRFQTLHLTPFYYLYFASTAWATSSVVMYFLLYIPVGIGFWLWVGRRDVRSQASPALTVALVSAGLAFVMEAGKLFIASKHPDTTNILLGASGGASGFALWPWLIHRTQAGLPTPTPPAKQESIEEIRPHGVKNLRFFAFRIVSVLALGATAWGLYLFPSEPRLLAIAVTLYAVLMLRFPAVWLFIIPALLPTFDLAPWTGWFFFNEFDLLVLTTIGIGFWTIASTPSKVGMPRGLRFLLLAFGVSSFASLLIGLLPLQPLDLNAFSNYYSKYNALPAAKGFFEVAGLIPLVFYHMRSGVNVLRRFSAGMVMGLTGVILAVLWERLLFPGLLNFSSEFRVSGLFSSMHTGGSHIEAYLVAVLPFTVAWAFYHRSMVQRAFALLLFTAGTYALFVTFARGGYLGFGVSMTILAAGSLMTGAKRWRQRRPFFAAAALSVVIAVIVAVPILEGSYAKSRLALVPLDFSTRLAHWRDTLEIMDSGWLTMTFGMGLGRFPETYFYRNSTGTIPATYRYSVENDNAYLSLGAGDPIYLEQIVAVNPHTDYKLSLDLRSKSSRGSLNVMICERTYIESRHCKASNIKQSGIQEGWVHYAFSVDSGSLGEGPWFARRTVKLILENTGHGVADVDNVHLSRTDGRELVSNGDFSKGNEHWFFSAFNHWPWHIENIWVQAFFEQGWVGALLLFLLVSYSFATLLKATRQGHFVYVILLASLGGFLSVGLFGSPLEAPRIAFLFYLILLLPMLVIESDKRKVGGRDSRTIDADRVRTERVTSSQFSKQAETAMPIRPPRSNAVDETTERITRHADVTDQETTGAANGEAFGKLLMQLLGVISLIVAGGWLAMHSPAVHYDVRGLLHPVHPFLSLIALSFFICWSLGFPVVIVNRLTRRLWRAWLYPGMLGVHAIVAWLLISVSVSLDRIYKIVGHPTLALPWYWETAVRFVALFTALSLSITGGTGAAIWLAYRQKSATALLSWVITVSALFPLLYWAVVTNAATDNLTELMAGGGSVSAALLLSAFAALVAFGGTLLAAQLQRWRHNGLRAEVLVGFMFSLPLAYLAVRYGTEDALVKYGQVFSAMQFLLSPDRAHYAHGYLLMLRYLVVYFGTIGLFVLIQYPVLGWLFGSRKNFPLRNVEIRAGHHSRKRTSNRMPR